MKINIKGMFKNFFCVLILSTCFNFISADDLCLPNLNEVYAADTSGYSYVGGNFDYELIPKAENFSGKSDQIKAPIKRIWATLILIFQIASVGGIVIAGLRYMFTSADKKAEIKQSMIHLIIGLVIVFGASTVVSVVTNSFNEIVGS